MGVSTAGVLSFKSISYSQNLVLAKMFRAYFSFKNYTNLYHRFLWLFKGYSFWSMGVVLKRTEMFVFGGGTLCTLSPDLSCQHDVPGHDGNSPGVDGTQVGIIKQPDKVRLRCLLETQYHRRLEPQVCFVVLGDLSHQPLEGQLADQKCCGFLKVTNVLQSHGPRSVPVGFHQLPLHPRLVDLLLLRRSPVQHTMAQQGSFCRARDVEDWQLSVDWGVSCARLAWFFLGHHRSWWFTLIPCLPMLVRAIIITVVVPASLSTSGPSYASATCAGATAIPCTACGFLAHFGSVCQLQTLAVRGVFILGIGTCCPCFFLKLARNSLIWSVLQPRFAKAFCRARIRP